MTTEQTVREEIARALYDAARARDESPEDWMEWDDTEEEGRRFGEVEADVVLSVPALRELVEGAKRLICASCGYYVREQQDESSCECAACGPLRAALSRWEAEGVSR